MVVALGGVFQGKEMIQWLRDLRAAFRCGLARWHTLRWQAKRRRELIDEFGDM